jgi:hypothetical protein
MKSYNFLALVLLFFTGTGCKPIDRNAQDLATKNASSDQVSRELFDIKNDGEERTVKVAPRAALTFNFWGDGQENAKISLLGVTYEAKAHGSSSFGIAFQNTDSYVRTVKVKFYGKGTQVEMNVYPANKIRLDPGSFKWYRLQEGGLSRLENPPVSSDYVIFTEPSGIRLKCNADRTNCIRL